MKAAPALVQTMELGANPVSIPRDLGHFRYKPIFTDIVLKLE